jgi:hypothetical protein
MVKIFAIHWPCRQINLRYIDREFYSNWKLFIYHTNSCTVLQYYYFTSICISAFRMPSSGGGCNILYNRCIVYAFNTVTPEDGILNAEIRIGVK